MGTRRTDRTPRSTGAHHARSLIHPVCRVLPRVAVTTRCVVGGVCMYARAWRSFWFSVGLAGFCGWLLMAAYLIIWVKYIKKFPGDWEEYWPQVSNHHERLWPPHAKTHARVASNPTLHRRPSRSRPCAL